MDSERASTEGGCLYFRGRREGVFAKKAWNSSFMSFSFTIFPRRVSDFRLKGGGKSLPLKGLGGSDYLTTPPMPTYDPRCFGYAVVEGLLSWNNIWAALWHAVSLYLAILILLSTIMLSTPILFSYFDYFSMKSEIKICDSHISVFLPLWTFLPFFMQKLLRALFVGSTKMNITLSCALLWAIHARLFDCGAR